jgi:hypothetical protein
VLATLPYLDHAPRWLSDFHDHAVAGKPHANALDWRSCITQRADRACDVSLRHGGRAAGH